MRSDKSEQISGFEDASYRELRLLEEVQSTPEISQRHLALRLGIALGVANVLVRSLSRQGYIRVTRVRWKRWIYILTSAGIAHKVRLTLAYIERFLDHYRRVRTLVDQDLVTMAVDGNSRVAIYGTTELAELVYLALRDKGVTRIDVFDRDVSSSSFLGLPVKSLDSIEPRDYIGVMVAFSGDVEARRRDLQVTGVALSQIVTPLQNPHRVAISAQQHGQEEV